MVLSPGQVRIYKTTFLGCVSDVNEDTRQPSGLHSNNHYNTETEKCNSNLMHEPVNPSYNEPKGERGMQYKISKRKGEGRWERTPCLIGVLLGLLLLGLTVSLIAMLINQNVFPQNLGRSAAIAIPGIAIQSSTLLTMALTRKAKRMNALLTAGILLLVYAAGALLLPGRTGTGILYGLLIGILGLLISLCISVIGRRAKYRF